MPILLSEDLEYPLPAMHRVKQTFPDACLEDVEDGVRRELAKPAVRAKVPRGARVAVAVGSRGIRNLSRIVYTVLREIEAMGGEPFILSAMGSHGSGTPLGQREVLASYGITEETMGVPVVTEVEVEHLGRTSRSIDIYFDRQALAADVVVPINRIKLHTDFVHEIQSGLCKMLVIGLGNHKGCSAVHEVEFAYFGETLLEGAQRILRTGKVGFGLGIVENAYDQTAHVEAIPAESLIAREKELVRLARDNMPTLMIPEIDVLIVREIGKNISGAGFDPNILGRSLLLKEFVLPVPEIGKMVLLGLTEETHGNAIGMGLFDVITRQVFDRLDLESIYANAIACKCIEDAKIPLIAADEDEAVRIAVKTQRGLERKSLRIVRIQNTLALSTIEVSPALLDYVRADPRLELLD